MITRDDLLQEFGEVTEVHGCYFAKYTVATFDLHCCLRTTDGQDLMVVSKNINDPELASSVVLEAPRHLSHDRPTIFTISSNAYGFTHAMAVPSTYHGFLNQIEGRANLFLCVPIFQCEFSGEESAEEFRLATTHVVPIYEWDRTVQPKVSVYFDTPRTGGGTDESGALVPLRVLLAEIDNLSGVGDGFIEITNYRDEVIEVLSPEKGSYVLIRNRQDEEMMERVRLVAAVETFTTK
ncbi:hypothetical protein CR156_19330 [Stenotrophomonas lactitubi]|uniref:hypothetical protein n=1 Tax=Stenotrophomonas lactitubi TaxID=2045214 RepID=UPI000C26F382|nr:hypothetical protein [Stenotrophomonas lactitubi]PJO54177.1 hypothetical protein CR156_19330 [Stenotrophomonas lactitubi]